MFLVNNNVWLPYIVSYMKQYLLEITVKDLNREVLFLQGGGASICEEPLPIFSGPPFDRSKKKLVRS